MSHDVGDFGFEEGNHLLVVDEVDGKGFVADAVEAVAAMINSFAVDDEIAVVEGLAVINRQVVVL